MPNRIIKDSINESMGLSECSVFAEDLFKRLITYADDYGRFNADTTIMRARLYPRELEIVSEQDIIDALVELSGVGKIEFYEPAIFNQFHKRGIYGAFPNWGSHQRVRDSKSKCPDPGDTQINDWYLRRFVSLDMKVQILERDNFKCQVCGKFVTTCRDARRFAKLGSGLYHIDHVVPVVQGGRATLENLRVTCPTCNLARKKIFTFAEILNETLAENGGERGENCELAASRRESPQVAARAGAESESESESESNTKEKSACVRAREGTPPPSQGEVETYIRQKRYKINAARFIAYYRKRGWQGVDDWREKLDEWNGNEINDKGEPPKESSFDTDDFFAAGLTRSYGDDQLVRDLKAKMGVTA